MPFRPGDKVVITKVYTVLGNMESDEEYCLEDKNGNKVFVNEQDIWFENENAPQGIEIKDDGF